MDMRTLNWPAIGFGSASGLATSLVLFAVLFGLGQNAGVQIAILMFGFFIAGYVSGRFALAEPQLSGGLAALILFFVITVVTISGAGLNLLGILVFGIGAAVFGPLGGTVGYRRHNS
jgi:hypothetical protein